MRGTSSTDERTEQNREEEKSVPAVGEREVSGFDIFQNRYHTTPFPFFPFLVFFSLRKVHRSWDGIHQEKDAPGKIIVMPTQFSPTQALVKNLSS